MKTADFQDIHHFQYLTLLLCYFQVKRRVEKLRQAVKKVGLPVPDVPSSPTSNPSSAVSAVVSTTATACSAAVGGAQPTNIKKEMEGEREVFMTQLTALNCPRSMKTRRLALAEDNPEMTKAARLACLFKDLFAEVTNAKGEFQCVEIPLVTTNELP